MVDIFRSPIEEFAASMRSTAGIYPTSGHGNVGHVRNDVVRDRLAPGVLKQGLSVFHGGDAVEEVLSSTRCHRGGAIFCYVGRFALAIALINHREMSISSGAIQIKRTINETRRYAVAFRVFRNGRRDVMRLQGAPY
jgi:hypothetical protein